MVVMNRTNFTISMFGGCGGLKRIHFSQFLYIDGCGGLDKT